MGKKKKSKFIKQQTYNQHLQNKAESNINHAVNRTTKRIDSYQKDYENSIKEIMTNFMKENGLDPDKVPSNSRILVYELLRKNVKEKLDIYNKYIDEHPDVPNITEYLDAVALCNHSLTEIDWLYDWTFPFFDNSNYDLGEEEYESLLKDANKKLEESEKKFDSLNDALETINKMNREKDLVDDIRYDFYKFCKFIVKNDIDKYYIYISNTIKNLKILNTSDPIVDYMLKRYGTKISIEENSKEQVSE